MKIQSLSIHVPTGTCLNNCACCVSRMHESPYENRIGDAIKDTTHFHSSSLRAEEEYIRRLQFAKDNGVNTIILTGTGEAIQNKPFLRWFDGINRGVGFRWIELQTAGNLLLKYTKENKSSDKIFFYENFAFLRDIGVSTISLSLFDIFDSKQNSKLVSLPQNQYFEIDELCKKTKDFHFNLRLSLNISNVYDKYTIEQIFDRAKDLNADQITFRKLYTSKECNTPQDEWILEHPINKFFFDNLNNYVSKNGVFLGRLPFGAMKYSINDVSVVVDDNCMDDATKREDLDSYKYLILRPNCKLYSDWNTKGSLIF